MNERWRHPQTIVFLGLSGSGKGTQVGLLLGLVPHMKNISTGRAFRRIAKKPTLVGRYLRGIMWRGGLVPYWAPVYIWLAELFERLSGTEHLAFDGSPRRIEEARMMDAVMGDTGRALPIAVYLRLSKRAAEKRLLSRGRLDDNRRAIAGRLRFFRKHVSPVIRYYRIHGRLITINGDQPIPAVWRDIRKALHLA